MRFPPTPCRVCFRPRVFNRFSHFLAVSWCSGTWVPCAHRRGLTRNCEACVLDVVAGRKIALLKNGAPRAPHVYLRGGRGHAWTKL